MKYLTILIPCYNEEDTIVECINRAKSFIEKENINGEILVVDNNSTDNSYDLAKKAGARIIKENMQGYGAALIRGNKEAKGKYIIMGDADCSYDFSCLKPFIKYLDKGYDLVVGNRFNKNMEKGAMKFSHKYIGVPILSGLGKILFKIKINDFHCGLRGYKKEKILDLNLKSNGMEYASEIIIKAHIKKLKIKEVPIVLHKDHRVKTTAKLNTIRDGFRHLKLILKLYFRRDYEK